MDAPSTVRSHPAVEIADRAHAVLVGPFRVSRRADRFDRARR
ncbi:hypothetical protein [Streptomyces minutiscleroticus]|uniref:Uncharacterized protein n=1 Tax=Streptomyces minutiscleroticus TaxID=68238 RepID=A0A918NSJ2_9ACTN|nr:hypothetical protein [Streptomyces minutiscleroticus]GGX92021.1 hypothetical protein GCM10010358_52330 [Streptomyces minutiscleroticus]